MSTLFFGGETEPFAVPCAMFIKVLLKYSTFDHVFKCFHMSILTLTLMVLLEYYTWNAKWVETLKKKGNWELYLEAWKTNLVHYFIIGPLAYFSASIVVLEMGSPVSAYISGPGVFLTQSVGYALIHHWMHKPKNYARIHKYHHGFSELTFVRPVTANATTTEEFMLAYAIPIVSGIMLWRPTMDVVFYIVGTISVTNLIIHTDTDSIDMSWAPEFLVTNLKHFHHHEKNVKRHYSAPIFDLDHILGIVDSKIYQKKDGDADRRLKTCPASGQTGESCPLGFQSSTATASE
jgi:sterol desaturase/sphingolipid hydroxylase (fatty acid hydroxylase superfamily)